VGGKPRQLLLEQRVEDGVLCLCAGQIVRVEIWEQLFDDCHHTPERVLLADARQQDHRGDKVETLGVAAGSAHHQRREDTLQRLDETVRVRAPQRIAAILAGIDVHSEERMLWERPRQVL